MINWDDVIISTITSGVVAFGIAFYFKYWARPKIEIIFDDNRKESFNSLFSNLASFDSYFQSFYEIFERDVTELKGSNKQIIPLSPIMREILTAKGEKTFRVSLPQVSSSLLQNFEFTKRNLEPMLEQMRKLYKAFSDDYSYYHNYMHETFLRDVILYYASTTDYVRWVLQGQDYAVYLASRERSAFKMIWYLEGDKSIDKSFPNVMDFITKWHNITQGK